MDSSKNSFTVSAVSTRVSSLLEDDFSLKNIFLRGEVLEFVHHSSGHMYMTLIDIDSSKFQLKKERSLLKCTFFRGRNQYSTFIPVPGVSVLCKGSIRVYAPNSSYSFNIESIQEIGEGTFLKRIQDLREKLIKEGAFTQVKKILPILPYKVALITSTEGAALRDIKCQIDERYPNVNILVAPVLVQGIHAEDNIVQALCEVQKQKYKCDVILLSRGGGSVEDLLPFSGEKLARKILMCTLPVVSAIGHQIDHPISNDVADVIAGTPTDGAKKVFPIIQEFYTSLDIVSHRLSILISSRIESARMKYTFLWELFIKNSPQRKIENFIQLLEKYTISLHDNFRYLFILHQRTYLNIPSVSFFYRNYLDEMINSVNFLSLCLESVSPFKVLKRGYSMVRKNDKVISYVKEIETNDIIEIQMQDGTRKFIVTNSD